MGSCPTRTFQIQRDRERQREAERGREAERQMETERQRETERGLYEKMSGGADSACRFLRFCVPILIRAVVEDVKIPVVLAGVRNGREEAAPELSLALD